MKKYYILFILILIIIFTVDNESVMPVFNENDYDIYYLDFRNTNLNTNNFNDYFNEEIDILKISPYINPIYKNKFSFDEYLFNYSSINNNIKIFKEKYLNELKKYNYDDYNYSLIYGIKIDMVKVYSNKKNINNLLNKDKNVKYVFNYIDYIDI